MPQHDKRPAGQGGKGANISIQQPRKQWLKHTCMHIK
jgi:hypothetical protein